MSTAEAIVTVVKILAIAGTICFLVWCDSKSWSK